ncbi:insulin-like peptide receptor [Anopheles ziemanni]|uniref:insulin-like peptide receptor n=1 Tax=Anopheles coustani TaxID=139045 RepID=UPI002657DD98|nr:insulin-like peptide receptor [Anopheles coustani]XP_058177355.1 insulin-like peptide receptor [Anopheles ziemanni]
MSIGKHLLVDLCLLLVWCGASETLTVSEPPITATTLRTLGSNVTSSIASNRTAEDFDESELHCSNIDIRNGLSQLRLIQNCTVINGYLHMMLMDGVPTAEFTKYSLPNLREITGYLLLFRLINLVSLRNLFPNLMVIRGHQLIRNYALILYDMKGMIELGLKNLIAIQRGYIYTQHCPLLCHLDTIDWSSITVPTNTTKNRNYFETPKVRCNSVEVCRGCEPKYCWGSTSCQKFYNGYNFNGKIKCHKQCLGGCTGTKDTDCKVCRGWKEGKRCVEQCSHERLQYRHTNRCITWESCLKRGGRHHLKECVLECPAGYSPTNVDQEVADFDAHTCFPCQNRCPKVCDSADIMYLSDVDRFRGCTVINGSLHIRLKEDHPDLIGELKSGLMDVVEIMGILKVFRSNFISSLEFLPSLEIIHGQETGDNTNFSLMVYENSNLQRLWNFEEKKMLQIMSRGMYFRNNALLCNAHIVTLRNITEYDNSTDTIDWGSNGYMQACYVEHFRVRSEVLSSRNVTVYWGKYLGKTQHRLLGYMIYYIRTNGDKTPYEGRDMCSKFGWRTRFVQLESMVMKGEWYMYNLTRLKPYTRYAFYVRTYFNETINSSTDHVGLSEVHYFKTAKDRPTSPQHVRTVRKSDTSITLGWVLFPSELELVSLYHVDVFIEPDEPGKFDQRNFCLHPHEPSVSNGAADDAVDLSAACSKEFCCDLLELEEEADDEDGDDEEVTGPDGFFGEKRSIEESTRRANKKSSVVYDEFEKSMLNLLRDAGAERQEQQHGGRSRRDTEEIKFVNRIAARSFTTDNYQYTVEGLEPYRYYIFQLFACSENNTMYCSAYSLYADRTDRSPFIDQLNVTILTDNLIATAKVQSNDTAFLVVKTTIGDRIVLHFPEPKQVNGLTVAYRIELEWMNGTVIKRSSRCITRLEHEQQQHIHTIRDVSPGEYLIRVQLISLAGPGPFTEWMFIRVLAPPPPEEMGHRGTQLRDGLIAFAVVLIFAAFGGAGAFMWKRRQRGGAGWQDDKIPLADNDGNQVELDDGFVNCSLK